MNKYGNYVILKEIDKPRRGTVRSDAEYLTHATYNLLLKGVYNAQGWLRTRPRVSVDTKKWVALYLLILGVLLLISAGL